MEKDDIWESEESEEWNDYDEGTLSDNIEMQLDDPAPERQIDPFHFQNEIDMQDLRDSWNCVEDPMGILQIYMEHTFDTSASANITREIAAFVIQPPPAVASSAPPAENSIPSNGYVPTGPVYTLKELKGIPGIGPVLAEHIKKTAPDLNKRQLSITKGIGVKKLAVIKSWQERNSQKRKARRVKKKK